MIGAGEAPSILADTPRCAVRFHTLDRLRQKKDLRTAQRGWPYGSVRALSNGASHPARFMSENLSALAFRKSAEKNLFERMVEAAEKTGTAANPETVRQLGEESLFGDAFTLGAVSFYDFLKKENAGKKVFVCNGSACLCAGTQDRLHDALGGHFKEEEIGHICCLGRCHTGGAFQYQEKNYSGQPDAALKSLFSTGKGDSEDRYEVVSHLQPPQLTAPFPGVEEYYEPFRELLANAIATGSRANCKDSGLRGRGGAGFPLHFKWSSCRASRGRGEVHRLQCRRGRSRRLHRQVSHGAAAALGAARHDGRGLVRGRGGRHALHPRGVSGFDAHRECGHRGACTPRDCSGRTSSGADSILR